LWVHLDSLGGKEIGLHLKEIVTHGGKALRKTTPILNFWNHRSTIRTERNPETIQTKCTNPLVTATL
jgi:hypothetical protein